MPSWGGVRRYSGGKPGERVKGAVSKDDQFFAGIGGAGAEVKKAGDGTAGDLKKLADFGRRDEV